MTGYMFGKGVYTLQTWSPRVPITVAPLALTTRDSCSSVRLPSETCEWCVVCEGRALVGG